MTTPPTERERPILFSGPMVRALLAGRKTQTRRLYRPRYPEPYEVVSDRVPHQADECGDYHRREEPYGIPGDRLWVRETWMELDREVYYRATDPAWDAERENTKVTWRPSIFMPRRFSRLTLEVTDVRVEQLQDISDADVVAEGLDLTNGDRRKQDGFAELWDSLNAARAPWSANPWVWRVAFRVRP